MIICESYTFEFSVSKDMKEKKKKKRNKKPMKGGGNREDINTFISNTNCQGIEN